MIVMKPAMVRIALLLILMLFVALLSTLMHTAHVKARSSWQSKVEPWVLEAAASQASTEFLIVLAKQADLSSANLMPGKLAKGNYVYETLVATARDSQGPLIRNLATIGVPYRAFWIRNMVWARGDVSVIEAIARRSDVAYVYANPQVKLDVVTTLDLLPRSPGAAAEVEWNIRLVKAPDVWAAGVSGQGAVIGGQDTGYDWQHPALREQYRGWDGNSAQHDYNWHDAIHDTDPGVPGNNPCGYDSLEPCDDHGHGTHTMGTMVGDDGQGNQIGMAPGAEWIACRNMDRGVGTPASYAECYEWFVAPYPLGGDPMTDGDPAKAPHAINNSWSCPASEGCTEPNILRQVVENVRAAGILTAHSASNAGPSCSTIKDPAAIYDASFSVGATNSQDAIAGFSSRGPVIVGNNDPAKPDISAPGVGVRSSSPGNNYSLSSGTSMASPHVAGLAGLLVAARPDLAGEVDVLERAIMDSAVRLTTNEGCGGDQGDSIPNHVYGWGRIDALAAFRLLTEGPPSATATPSPSPSPPAVTPTATAINTPTAVPHGLFIRYIPVWLDN